MDDQALAKKFKALETEDFQNRFATGDYPKSGIADTIDVWVNESGITLRAYFKNTDERRAETWLRRYLNSKGLGRDRRLRFEIMQDGDYHNDWVIAKADIDF